MITLLTARRFRSEAIARRAGYTPWASPIGARHVAYVPQVLFIDAEKSKVLLRRAPAGPFCRRYKLLLNQPPASGLQTNSPTSLSFKHRNQLALNIAG
jgi:hypothetical protein